MFEPGRMNVLPQQPGILSRHLDERALMVAVGHAPVGIVLAVAVVPGPDDLGIVTAPWTYDDLPLVKRNAIVTAALYPVPDSIWDFFGRDDSDLYAHPCLLKS